MKEYTDKEIMNMAFEDDSITDDSGVYGFLDGFRKCEELKSDLRHNVRLSLPSIEEIEMLEKSIIAADPTLVEVLIKDLREQIFSLTKKIKKAITNEA